MLKLTSVIAAAVIMTGCAGLGSTGMMSERSVKSEHNVKKITSEQGPVMAGEKSTRFELRPGECMPEDCMTNRARAEIMTDIKIFNGQKKWISAYVYVPEDTQFTKHASADIFEIFMKGRGVNWRPLFNFNITGNAFFSQWIQQTRLRDGTWAEFGFVEPISKVSELRGKWTQLMFYLDTDMTKGKFQAFVNGKVVHEVDVPINTPADEWFGFKFGIYRAHLNRERDPVPTSVLYFDELRYGDTREEVDDILNPALKTVD